MCQRETAVACNGVKVVASFNTEQRQEIDWRVAQKLFEREYFKQQYVRGLTDAFYYMVIFAMLAYAAYIYFKAEE